MNCLHCSLSVLLLVLTAPVLFVCGAKGPNCVGHRNGATFSDERLCCRFYICINGFARRRNCGRSFSFDTISKRCLPSIFVDCKESYGFAVRPPFINPEGEDMEDPSTDLLTTITLGTTTVLNAITDPATTTVSGTATDPHTTTEQHTTTEPATATEPATTIVADTTIVTSFVPAPGTSTTVTPNPNCAPPATVTIKTQSVRILMNPLDCQQPGNEGSFVVDVGHCRVYYQCFGGVALRRKCPPGQWFERNAKICSHRAFVQSCPINRN